MTDMKGILKKETKAELFALLDRAKLLIDADDFEMARNRIAAANEVIASLIDDLRPE